MRAPRLALIAPLLILCACDDEQGGEPAIDAMTRELDACGPIMPKEISAEFRAAFDEGTLEYSRAALTADWAVPRVIMERARDMEPCLPGPWRYLSAIAQKEGDHRTCIAAGNEALRLNPSSQHGRTVRRIVDECTRARDVAAHQQ